MSAYRLKNAVESWQGTRYLKSQGVKGKGVDCLRFVVAVIDETFEVTAPMVGRLPDDVAQHSPEITKRVVRMLKKRWDGKTIKDSSLLPCDVLMIHNGGDSPGHIAVVGWVPGTLWHADFGTGVCCSPIAGLGDRLRYAWRPYGKGA